VIQRVQPSNHLNPETLRRRERYETQRAQFAIERDDLRRRWNILGNVRLGAFLAAVVFLLAGLQSGSVFSYALVVLSLVGFIFLIARHRKLGRAHRRAAALHDLNNEALLRADRAWNELPLRHTFPELPGHPFANDLDLFGHASLFHLLETVETPMGADRLRQWLLNPATTKVIEQRHELTAELAPELEWRQELGVRGRLIGSIRPDPEPLLKWAEGDRWLSGRQLLRIIGIIGPAAFLLSVIAAALGAVPSFICILLFGINIIVSQAFASEARIRIALVAEHYPSISQYAQLLQHIEQLPGESSASQNFLTRLKTEGHRASELLHTLGRRASFAVPPGTLLYLPLQGIFAWDINVLSRLESWQAIAGNHVRDWLDLIGETEALVALSALAYDQPDWTRAEVRLDATAFTATNLGHPLLPDEARVVNDVEVGPTGTFLLVTGSNMSGKSTLLRSIGVNNVLASAGGPVCATTLVTPLVRLWTSVRVEDSLERGVSFFMAELQRLKQVVDAATDPEEQGRTLFYLLDEILQGTNTAERQVAARRVIRHLVDSGALGAVSTHDLTLAEGPELSEVAVPVHLRDTMTDTGMSFDYKLRPGVATSTNALRLMDIVFGTITFPTTSPEQTADG